jgi:putative glutamine amidotransferase
MMKKIILITSTCVFNSEKKQHAFMLDQMYGDAIMAAGGIPVIMGNERIPEDYAQIADGLLITGGESVHPRYFGETFDNLANNSMETIKFLRWGCNIARDEMEFAVYNEFVKLGKPVMGICRGMQLINAATGGKNDLDFPRRHPVEHNMGVSHKVEADLESIVGRMLGQEFLANSFHRDCVVSTGPDVRVTARSVDSIIEAIEHIKLPIMGVQFHPERMCGNHPTPIFGPDATNLFRYFLNIC